MGAYMSELKEPFGCCDYGHAPARALHHCIMHHVQHAHECCAAV